METLKALIENSEFPIIQKNVLKGFVHRHQEIDKIKEEDINLIEQCANEKKISEIILSTDEVKIYTVYGNDEWHIKYPFRLIYFLDGVWRRANTVSPTIEIAFLVYLERKYLGCNSQFVDFAMKMLELKNID